MPRHLVAHFLLSVVSAQSFCGFQLPLCYTKQGVVVPRNASSIVASNWSIGAETMDRNYTIFDNWRAYVSPLGAKHARVQAGWARCEPHRGQYEWAWLDEIVQGLASSGTTPWLQVSYGNPSYGPGAGTPEASSPLPTSPVALQGWHSWVSALVSRYSAIVNTWEIWNEPNCQNISAADFAVFTASTATTIRAAQPAATIRFGVLCGVDIYYAKALVAALNSSGSLSLVDVLTYHPYAYNPDSVYGDVDELASAVRVFSPHVSLAQGENGAPSVGGGYGAIAQYNWTECSQVRQLVTCLSLFIEYVYSRA